MRRICLIFQVKHHRLHSPPKSPQFRDFGKADTEPLSANTDNEFNFCPPPNSIPNENVGYTVNSRQDVKIRQIDDYMFSMITSSIMRKHGFFRFLRPSFLRYNLYNKLSLMWNNTRYARNSSSTMLCTTFMLYLILIIILKVTGRLWIVLWIKKTVSQRVHCWQF